MKHINFLLVLFIALGGTSCATLLNRKYTNVRIITEKPGEITVNDLSIKTRPEGIDFPAERKNEPLVIHYLSDSTEKIFTVNSINSFAYFANIFTNYGIGMLIDKDNPRRYGYPRQAIISCKPEDIVPRRFNPFVPAGSLYWHFSIPYYNNFYLQPLNEGVRQSAGFWGIATSVEYAHSRNQSLAVSAGAAMDFFLPVLVAVDYSGEWKSAATTYLSLAYKQYYKRFNAGLGIHVSRHFWNYNYSGFGDAPPPTRPTVRLSHRIAGPLVSAGWQLGKHTWAALSYKPAMVRFDLPYAYEHVISLEFGSRITLR